MSTRERLTDAERAALQAAEEAGYLVVTERMSEVKGAWYNRCDARGHPFIIIESRPRGRANVTLDTITWPHELTRAQEEAIAAAFRAARARRGLWPNDYSFGSVLWEVAEPLARALVQIVRVTATDAASP